MSARVASAGTAAAPAIGTVAEHALDGLRRALVSGELTPGERIGQEQIAASLGVSLAPVREALATLEQEGQVTYRPRRGYFVTELAIDDLVEIYELRALLEARAARHTLPQLDDDAIERIELAARDCAAAAEAEDVVAELEANRRFHFAILEAPEQPHTLRLIRLLWDSTETYRAHYYNAPEARDRSLRAHERIVTAIRAADADALVGELGAHRREALTRLERALS